MKKEDILCQSFGLHINGIERITEQLKAGGENGRSIWEDFGEAGSGWEQMEL